MSARETLAKVLDTLPEARLNEILTFVEFLNWKSERACWEQFGKTQLARAYGPNEPEYTSGDVKREHRS
jgi:hypothetical protein